MRPPPLPSRLQASTVLPYSTNSELPTARRCAPVHSLGGAGGQPRVKGAAWSPGLSGRAHMSYTYYGAHELYLLWRT
eukprot:scaffold102780_cov57-Phaeocystis_antarctica.AAC.1